MFQTLLFEIQPKIPNLLCLDLVENKVESVKSVVHTKIKVVTIVLLQNRFKSWTYAATLLRKNWVRILLRRRLCWAFLNHTLRYTVYRWKIFVQVDPDIEFALRIKHARRSIVESGGSNRSQSLPLSVWATILESKGRTKNPVISAHHISMVKWKRT